MPAGNQWGGEVLPLVDERRQVLGHRDRSHLGIPVHPFDDTAISNVPDANSIGIEDDAVSPVNAPHGRTEVSVGLVRLREQDLCRRFVQGYGIT